MNNVKDYKCFIASPGDTKEERDLCEEVFNEINNGIGKNLGFQLSSLRWEKDVYSSIGDYGQDVINKQIDAKYDFFIGIMKSRFGTPTPTAGSGTEEEFNNAFEKYRNGEIDNIFFFFGNTKESLNDIDPDQFKHVLEFKKRIHNQGLLSMEYVGLEDFKQKLRRNFENYFTDKKNRKRKVAKQDDKALICARTVSYDYRKLWETAMTLLHKNDSTQHIYTLLTKSKNRFCKIIFSQEHIVNHLMTNEPLTKEKAELFALAVSDIGQLPSYYNNCHKDDTELNKQSLWIQLKEREKSLSGSTELIYTTDDTSTYEQIQRCLFHLDFSKSKALVNSWNPKNFWVQHKAMRMAVYPELYNSSRVLLKKAIATETNSTEKFYEIILANYISSEWPRPFSIDEFLKYGLEGQGDLLNSMMANLRGKEEKPKRRGWIGSTHYLGDNNGDYCKSLRILQFIVDSGIYLNLQGTYMFEVASWYKVFTNLYEHFPYPCFFYSIQYADRDVLRRIGEDYAYNEGLQAFVQDILLKSMSSIANGDTPPLFRNGILHVTAAMYIAVDEYIWFDLFVETVFAEFCREIKSGYNELEFNVKLAIGSLKGTDHIKNVFIRLLSMLNDNEGVVSDIIVNNLMIDRLSVEDLSDVVLHFDNYLSPATLNILDTLNRANLLPAKIRGELIENVQKTPADNIAKDRVYLYQLTNLTCDDPKAIEIIKLCYLSIDLWHCGVINSNEFGWTEPQYIRMNLLNDKVSWSNEEFETIKQNLLKNIATYDKFHNILHDDSFMKTTQVRYLSDMLKFINGLDEVRQASLSNARREVERLLADRTHYSDNIDFMMSDQSADVDFAFSNIYERVQAQGIESCKDDIDFLIDRALMKSPIALTRNLRCIKYIVDENWEQMLHMGYEKKLNKVLSTFMESSSWESLDLRFAFNYLHGIAIKMNNSNVINEECKKFWLENEFIKKFVLE